MSTNEWYTPAKYTEAARAVMGGIDLDPASCELANKTVQANRIYAKADNGLEKLWYGRIWLNPPFGRIQTPGEKINQGIWIHKLVSEYQAGRTHQAVLLTTCRPDTSWFHVLWDFPICFADHKVGFYLPEEGRILQEHSHAHGTLFVYMGPHEDTFLQIFSRFGRIVRAIDSPKPRPACRELWEEGIGA